MTTTSSPAQHRFELGRRREQAPVARIQPGVQREPRAPARREPLRQLALDLPVAPAPPVLGLAGCEDDTGDGHRRRRGQRREVVPRRLDGGVPREDGVEARDRRVARLDHRHTDGDPRAARVPAVQVLDLAAVQRTAGEHQMRVGRRIGVVEVETARTEDRAPRQVAVDPRPGERRPHRLHRQHVARRRLTVQEARPSRHQHAHRPAAFRRLPRLLPGGVRPMCRAPPGREGASPHGDS
ncbi:hypothetical protein [Actinomadura madurae]|uniref:hypothetical protein n=1 Tax=Actinomadura madurae TaxID=1993 RepID=UPI0020D232CC|nr:hypothetical protein [Actinomadura madurae]MCP9976702.1 hypothetical protein [Actinomadura madurae]